MPVLFSYTIETLGIEEEEEKIFALDLNRQCHIQTQSCNRTIVQSRDMFFTRFAYDNSSLSVIAYIKNENQSLFRERIIAMIKTKQKEKEKNEIIFLPVDKTFRGMSIAFTSSSNGIISERIRIHIDIGG